MQKKIINIILILLFAGCSAKKDESGQSKALSAAFWPIFRGNQGLTGVSGDDLPQKMKLHWTFKTGDGIRSSPVLGFGNVYIGSTDGRLYALDQLDGKQIWVFNTEDDVEASPLLLDSTIYIGNLSGMFFALDAKNGRLIWKYDIKEAIHGSANWALADNGQDKLIFVGSYDAVMYAFKADRGKLQWTYETDDYLNGSPAIEGNFLVFGGCDAHLHVVNTLTGVKSGKISAGSYIPGSAALYEGRAYIGNYDNQLLCIDLSSNKILWKYKNKDHGGPFISSPAVNDTRVVIGCRDEYVHCLSRKTGEQLWVFRTNDEVDSSPVIVGSKVVVGSLDGRLYILDLKTGKELWVYETGGSIYSCPAVAGGRIVIGADDGYIYSFGEDS